jgi:hypothetical protein
MGSQIAKGPRKNKFTEFALRFRSYLVDLIERTRRNSRAILRIS